MSVVVRPFAKGDLEPSYAVWHRAWTLALPDEDVPALLPDWRRRLETELLPVRIVLAAERDGALAGFAVVDPAAGWLDQILVDPPLHGRGIGRLLLGAVRAIAPGPLAFRVVQSNAGAIAFYERLGFVRAGPAESPTTGWKSWLYRSGDAAGIN